MPQLDLNTFVGVAWWLTIVFYLSYLWVFLVPFTQLLIIEKAPRKYRLYQMLQLAEIADSIRESSR